MIECSYERLLQNHFDRGRKGLRPSIRALHIELEGGNPLPPLGVLQELHENRRAKGVTLIDMTPCDEGIKFLHTQAGEYA